MGFSLVELLVVISIIATLSILVVPALGSARAQSKKAKCASNLRQLGMAAQCYIDERNVYPKAYTDSTCRWMDLIKPYLEKKSAAYRCPADTKQIPVQWDPDITMSYGINVFRFGPQEQCFWYRVKGHAVSQPARTVLFADCTPGKYYCGGGSSFLEPVPDVDYRHPNHSFCAAFCDGHVESLQQTSKEIWDASK